MSNLVRIGRMELAQSWGDIKPWRPKSFQLSEETKAALALLDTIHSWKDLVHVWEESQKLQERKRMR